MREAHPQQAVREQDFSFYRASTVHLGKLPNDVINVFLDNSWKNSSTSRCREVVGGANILRVW